MEELSYPMQENNQHAVEAAKRAGVTVRYEVAPGIGSGYYVNDLDPASFYERTAIAGPTKTQEEAWQEAVQRLALVRPGVPVLASGEYRAVATEHLMGRDGPVTEVRRSRLEARRLDDGTYAIFAMERLYLPDEVPRDVRQERVARCEGLMEAARCIDQSVRRSEGVQKQFQRAGRYIEEELARVTPVAIEDALNVIPAVAEQMRLRDQAGLAREGTLAELSTFREAHPVRSWLHDRGIRNEVMERLQLTAERATEAESLACNRERAARAQYRSEVERNQEPASRCVQQWRLAQRERQGEEVAVERVSKTLEAEREKRLRHDQQLDSLEGIAREGGRDRGEGAVQQVWEEPSESWQQSGDGYADVYAVVGRGKDGFYPGVAVWLKDPGAHPSARWPPATLGWSDKPFPTQEKACDAALKERAEWIANDVGEEVRQERTPQGIARERTEEHVAPVPRELCRHGIRPETLHAPRFRGTWEPSAFDEAQFLHRDSSGHDREPEVVGRYGSGGGETASLWQSQTKATDKKLVVVDSVLDALSYHQFQPQANDHTRYISIGNNRQKLSGPEEYDPTVDADVENAEIVDRRAFSQRLEKECFSQLADKIARLPPGTTVLAAFPATGRGEQRSTRLERLIQRKAPELSLVRARPPFGRNWTQALERKERDYIRSLPGAPLRARNLER